jgi:large subunit ribosomal protein L21
VYAVISTGGKQARVSEGERLDVELLPGGEGDELTFTPILLVDGGSTLATADVLAGATVGARIVGETKGPKIKAMTYQAKARRRRRWGHRQRYTTIEITSISAGKSEGASAVAPTRDETPGAENPGTETTEKDD